MNSCKKILFILGIILIIIQAVSFIGMSRVYVGLYPDGNDLLFPGQYSNDSGLNIKKVIFAVEAGADRFRSSFGDLISGPDKYRPMTATQVASAMVRESLGCSQDGSVGLVVYDTILFISYSAVGIIGAILLFKWHLINTQT